MMRRAALGCAVFLFLSLSGCTLYPEKPVHAWKSATGGENLEHLFWDSVKDKAWLELEQHLAPTFVYVGPSGINEKVAALDYFQSLEIKTLNLGEMTVRPSGGDVIVVTYVLNIEATRKGKPLSAKEYRVTSTWQQIGKKWMLIARAHTPAVGPNPPETTAF